MVARHLPYFIIVFFTKQAKSYSVHFNMPQITEPNFNMESHLKYENVWEYCAHRKEACESNNTNICAMKVVNSRKYYKDFSNGCYLFLANMCDHPREEYYIVIGGTCEEYLAMRRDDDEDTTTVEQDYMTNTYNSSENEDASNTTDSILRKKDFSPLYDVDSAYDYHPCPYSCPKTYSPVCINVNRGLGKYFKMMTFVNHCFSDLYYCKNWREFEPPPGEDESVRSSPLSWSFCAASRFLQFARFSETASTLGHFGWLYGDQYKYSHIMEPYERAPGYG